MQELGTLRDVKAKNTQLLEEVKARESEVDELKQSLDDALGATDMAERLTDKNLELEERIRELEETVADLETLKEMSEEVDAQHAALARHLTTQLDFARADVAELVCFCAGCIVLPACDPPLVYVRADVTELVFQWGRICAVCCGRALSCTPTCMRGLTVLLGLHFAVRGRTCLQFGAKLTDVILVQSPRHGKLRWLKRRWPSTSSLCRGSAQRSRSCRRYVTSRENLVCCATCCPPALAFAMLSLLGQDLSTLFLCGFPLMHAQLPFFAPTGRPFCAGGELFVCHSAAVSVAAVSHAGRALARRKL